MKIPGFFVLLASLSLTACKHTDPAPTGLAGSWGGTYQTQQAGSCTWNGEASIAASASWQVDGNRVTGTLTRQYGQVSNPVSVTGTVTGNTVQLSETKANNVVCSGVARSYFAQYTGSLNGDMLNLVSLDTLCPAQGCIFRRTLQLTRQ